MIRLRQLVQSEHAEDGSERRAQNGHLERNRHERGRAMERAASDVERVVYDLHVVHHEVAGEAADDAAYQNDERQTVLVKPDGLRQLLYRKRRVAINPPIALVIGLARSLHQIGWTFELGHQAVKRWFRFHSNSVVSGRWSVVSRNQLFN